MFDTRAVAILKPLVDVLAKGLKQLGIGANALTVSGFLIGLGAAACIVAGMFWLAICLLLLSRLLDALDGAVARLGSATDKGGYLDITLDFLFYAAIPLAFAWQDRKSTRLNSSHVSQSRMPSSA